MARSTLRRLPPWLALAAMFFQLVASYGHIHPQDFRFLLRGAGTPVLAAGEGPSGGSSPVLPSDIDCPVCASVHLLGASALPDAIALVAPGVANIPSLAAVEPLWLTPPPHLLFVTRGPPLV